MRDYSKLFKTLNLVLILVSVAILLIGTIVGFENGGAWPVDLLFIWTYIMLALALVSIVCIGGYIGYQNDHGFIKKIGVVLGVVVVVVGVVFLISSGKPALGLLEQPSHLSLKITDTILNLTYILAVAAILSIVCGGFVAKIVDKRNKR